MVSGFIARGGLPKTPIALLHGRSVGFVGSKGSRTFVATNVPLSPNQNALKSSKTAVRG